MEAWVSVVMARNLGPGSWITNPVMPRRRRWDDPRSGHGMRWVMGLLVLAGSLAQVPGPMSVEVRTFQYSPASLQVTVGTEVVWSNRDAIAHTVTSGTPDGLIVGAALAAAPAAAQTSASDLRTGLNTMLAEHVYLA